MGSAGYDRDAPRREVSLSLNRDLLERAGTLTADLSATVETLLAGYVRREQSRRPADDPRLDAVIEALNTLHARGGFLSDEFPSL